MDYKEERARDDRENDRTLRNKEDRAAGLLPPLRPVLLPQVRHAIKRTASYNEPAQLTLRPEEWRNLAAVLGITLGSAL